MTNKTPVDDEKVFMRTLGAFLVVWLVGVAVFMAIVR